MEDLVKPQYRGKLVMADPTLHTTTAQWLVNVHKLIGKEKADKFVRDLAAMKPTLVESFNPAADRVTSGEFPIGITYVYYVYLNGIKGAPLDYVRTGKFLGDASYLDVVSQSASSQRRQSLHRFFSRRREHDAPWPKQANS